MQFVFFIIFVLLNIHIKLWDIINWIISIIKF